MSEKDIGVTAPPVTLYARALSIDVVISASNL